MGKRGEGWFILQIILFVVILLAPGGAAQLLPLWTRLLGLFILATGALAGTWGILSLGRNASPFPRPIEGGVLVTQGAYRLVRHPIYSGLILGTLGWAIFRSSLLGGALALILFVFFDLKSRTEERWLTETYAGYSAYQQRVRKLIPFLY